MINLQVYLYKILFWHTGYNLKYILTGYIFGSHIMLLDKSYIYIYSGYRYLSGFHKHNPWLVKNFISEILHFFWKNYFPSHFVFIFSGYIYCLHIISLHSFGLLIRFLSEVFIDWLIFRSNTWTARSKWNTFYEVGISVYLYMYTVY